MHRLLTKAAIGIACPVYESGHERTASVLLWLFVGEWWCRVIGHDHAFPKIPMCWRCLQELPR